MLTEKDLQELEQAARYIINVIERQRIHEENASDKRSAFQLVATENKILSFPGKKEVEKEKHHAAIAEHLFTEQEFVEFTEKEINKMPKQFRKIFTFNRRAAHVRKWKGVYEIRIQINGQRICATSKRLDDAKNKFIKKLLDYEYSGITVKKKKNLLVPYMQKWLETVKKPYIKENTYKFYTQCCNAYIFPKFENRTIESLTQFELQEFINEFSKQEKHRTADKISLILSAVLDYAVDDGIIQRSPMKRVVLQKYEEEHGQALTREEESKLVSDFLETKDIYAQAYVFMLYTGIRRGEMASVEIENGWCSVITGKQRKGLKEKRRKIPLSPMLQRFLPAIDLKAIIAISPGMLTKHIKDYLPAHHCHDLRHTFITRCQECGIKRELVSLWAGHAADSSITSTVYTHLEQNEELQVKEMLLFTYVLA